MALEVMTHAQTTLPSMFAQNSTPFKCRSGARPGIALSAGLRVMSSTILGGSKLVTKLTASSQSSKCKSVGRMVVMSILEEPRVLDGELSSSNETESLLEKFANMAPPNDTDLLCMNEAVHRLSLWDNVPKLAKKQTFTVYELNEFDRDSPAFLELSRESVNKIDPDTGAHIKALGDLVPFTNKLYDSTLEMRLGITTGICLQMKNYPGRGAPELHSMPFSTLDHYEAIMSWYFGDMGHMSGMGPFINFQDALMGITGVTGIFAEARGVVRLHPITPFKFMYTFTLSHIPELPKLRTKELVAPHFRVESHPGAFACKPGYTLPNYTN